MKNEIKNTNQELGWNYQDIRKFKILVLLAIFNFFFFLFSTYGFTGWEEVQEISIMKKLLYFYFLLETKQFINTVNQYEVIIR